MGKKSKRKRMNSSSMSSTPRNPRNNLTFNAVRNANETLYGPAHIVPVISSPQTYHTLQPAMQNMYTSTPIHNNVVQSNAPQSFPTMGHGYTAPMSTNHTSGMCIEQPILPMIIQDIQIKLQKLDLLDNVCERLTAIERKFDIVDQDIVQLKQSVQIQDKKLSGNDTDMRHFHNRISELECARRNLEFQSSELNETILEQQTRSMKYNVIFENITETTDRDPNFKEDTEAVLRTFIVDELQISDHIEFHNVHRLRKRSDRKPRSIVARFVHFKDKETVLRSAQTHLKDKRQNVYSQLPQEVTNRRKELVPVMKEFRDQGKHATLVVDKLYVDGQRFIPEANITRLRFRDDNRNSNGGDRQVRFT